jgi:hypothetical protein
MKVKIEELHSGRCDCGRSDSGFMVQILLTAPDGLDHIVSTTFACPDCIAEIGIEVIKALR